MGNHLRSQVRFPETFKHTAVCFPIPIMTSNHCLHFTDYAREGNVVDGDVIRVAAYSNGKYTYTAVSGGSKTVRQFTCNVNLVVATPDENEMKDIKLARPVGP